MKSDNVKHPWAAVWTLLIGFFMIMLDTTVVTVATPAILTDLDADIVTTQWVASAYLLALAAPMLVTGRLGDRFGQKNLVIVGLILFVAASTWCGLSTTIESLIAARAVQGIGAACLSPQSLAMTTRMFPPQQRGAPLGLWGASAGIAMLVGPIVGGLCVQNLGWPSIFFLNVPVGLIALIATVFLVPDLGRQRMRVDLVGAALSGIGILSFVVGLQEGERTDWGQLYGPFSGSGLVAAGVAILLVFVWWERNHARDPLVPMALFRERNFALGTTAVMIVGFTMTCIPIPLMYFYQIARGLTPAQAGLVLIPMAIVSGLLAPIVGRLTDRIPPRYFTVFGLIVVAIGTCLYLLLVSPSRSVWWFLIPSAISGIGSACMWGPISLVASIGLPSNRAGTGSAIYNVMRQLGSVFGAAAITAVMESRLTSNLNNNLPSAHEILEAPGRLLPPSAVPDFATAMAESLSLPIGTAVIGLLVALGFSDRMRPLAGWEPSRERPRSFGDIMLGGSSPAASEAGLLPPRAARPPSGGAACTRTPGEELQPP